MASLRDIRQKIKGVSSTKQITNAMKMMSTARLNRAQETIRQNRIYALKLASVVNNLRKKLSNLDHPSLKPRPVIKSVCIIVLGGERGLCGGFNSDLHKYAYKVYENYNAEKKDIIVVGKKASRFFEKCGIEPKQTIIDLTLKDVEKVFTPMCQSIFSDFLAGTYDEILVVYTSFEIGHRELTTKRIMPVPEVDKNVVDVDIEDITFEYNPSPDIIFDRIMPRYLQSMLFMALLENMAAEQRARMTAMTSATDRAGEIVDDLVLELNRSRQAIITQEINEVISGSLI